MGLRPGGVVYSGDLSVLLKGGGMVELIEELKQQLMNKIDQKNLMEVEKVERYISLVNSFNRINRAIINEGETILTENGSQRFIKAHPLISERNKINAALLSIERSFEFDGEKRGHDLRSLI